MRMLILKYVLLDKKMVYKMVKACFVKVEKVGFEFLKFKIVGKLCRKLLSTQ